MHKKYLIFIFLFIICKTAISEDCKVLNGKWFGNLTIHYTETFVSEITASGGYNEQSGSIMLKVFWQYPQGRSAYMYTGTCLNGHIIAQDGYSEVKGNIKGTTINLEGNYIYNNKESVSINLYKY